MPSPLWFVCGALLALGIVGFFTGLLLLPLAVGLLVRLHRQRVPGRWLVLVGMGAGTLALSWSDVVGHPATRCVMTDVHGGFECRPAASVPIFFVGAVLGGAGMVLGIANGVLHRRSNASGTRF